jgi:uncharacterized protein (DUF302 family)
MIEVGMAQKEDYALKVTIDGESPDTVESAVRDALSDEGFGVLTEIDVQATMKKKLDVDRDPYVILGACNPKLANQALDAEPSIGVLLPCNVVVYQNDEGGVSVEALDPRSVFSFVDNDQVQPVADEVAKRLQRCLDAVSKQFA